jgi:hypothetical protein
MVPITGQLAGQRARDALDEDPGRDGDRISVPAVLALLRGVLAEGEDGRRGVRGMLADEDVGPAAAAALEDQLLRARSTVARLRRRDHELSALFSSARELVELQDVDVLLRRLVQRAHDLVGTDITYLAEFDDTNGELYIRAAMGSVTPAFHEVRVPPGKGLATKVAQTRSAHWCTRYMDDTDLDHDDGVDAAIAGEGIVSMAGVPMLVGDRTVGVLVAANRSAKSFSTEEIVLLAAFADHAAVVLQNARLLDRARTSAADAEAAYAELTGYIAAMERASALHSELTAAVLRGGSAEEVASILGGALHRSVLIVDRHGAPIATSAGADELPSAEPLPAPVLAAIDESRRTGRVVEVPDEPRAASVVAVVAGESLLGAVLVEGREPALEAMDRRSVERAAQIVALLTLRQEAVTDAEERVRGELVSDVLGADSVYRRELLLRARSRGVRIAELRTPVVVVVAPEHRRAALRAANDVAPGVLAGEHTGTLTVLLPTEPPLDAATAVRDRIRQVVPGPVLVVAGPAGVPDTLHERFDLARRCSRLLIALERTDVATCTAGFAPYLAMFGTGREDLGIYIRHTIGAVLDWDRERNTELLPTLLGFVDANASPTRTARNLGLHTNTVLQRLERITALLGPGWREPEPLFRVGVAVRLQRLAALL